MTAKPPIVAQSDKTLEQASNANHKQIRFKSDRTMSVTDPDLLAVNPLEEVDNQPLGRESNQRQQLPPVKHPAPSGSEIVKAEPKPVPPPALEQNDPAKRNKWVPVAQAPATVPSGWFRDDQLFRISYRPSGHADDCIQSWIELVTRAADANTRLETKQLFQKTIEMTSIGLCRACHTVDQLPNRSFRVNWKAEYRDPAIRSFTSFAHGPHLIQPGLRDCSGCHTLDSNVRNHESFVGMDSAEVVSNFLPITKSNCISCHQANQASSGCTQCHNYHVGSRVMGTQ